MAQSKKPAETGCCPRFNPAPWDGKLFTWKSKKFIKGSVFCLFYMPLNFGSVITSLMKKMEIAGAECPDSLGLSDHTSPFNMDICLAADKEVPGCKNLAMSGKFLCKVYEGPFQDTGKWCKDFSEYSKKKGIKPGKLYMWYTTCPKCAKAYGKNYVAIFAKV